MLKKTLKFFLAVSLVLTVIFSLGFTSFAEESAPPQLTLRTHVSNIGWTEFSSFGKESGAPYKNFQIEALTVSTDENSGISVNYGVHVSNIGWMSGVKNGEIAGTSGRALGIESVYITLSGENAELYDVYYRTYVLNEDWTAYSKNGEYSGTTGRALPITAIEAFICKKGEFVKPEPKDDLDLRYFSHVSDIGWESFVKKTGASGPADDFHQTEAMVISLNTAKDLSLSYRVHVSNIGWMNPAENGKLAGTTGMALSIEAFSCNLTGTDAENYDIFYRCYVKSYGWLNWAKNGENSGSAAQALPISSFEVKICEKGSFVPEGDLPAFIDTVLTYQTHISNIGWTSPVQNRQPNGTTDESKQIEAFIINIKSANDLNLKYRAHVSDIGWMKNESSGQCAGTTGRALGVEAISINLFGADAEKYDIFYHTYVQSYGWLNWAKNGENSGSTGKGLHITAMQIILCKKGEFVPEYAEMPSEIKENSSYSTHISNIGWSEELKLGEDYPVENLNNSLEAFKLDLSAVENLGVSYMASVQNEGDLPFVTDGEIAGTVGKAQKVNYFCINLTGADAEKYDVYYRSFVDKYGWLGWAKNGEKSGAVINGYSIHGIYIAIYEKGKFLPASIEPAFVNSPSAHGNALFVIDAGHGGGDPGATGVDGRYESNDTIKIAEEVIRILNLQGFETYLINRNLKTHDRPLEANSVNGDLFISLHRDSSGAGANGISIYTHEPTHYQRTQQPEKDYAPNEQSNKHEIDEILIRNLERELSTASAIRIKGVYYGSASAPVWEDYYINRLSNMPSCIVEYGFVTNAGDNAIFDSSYKSLAKATAKALIQTAGYTFNESLYVP